MRQLLPVATEIDPALEHGAADRSRDDGRPWLLANMVASLDGATTIEGRSGGLGGAADKEVFTALRAVADFILVGAATVRSEGYGPPRTPESRQRERLARGQAAFPRIAVVSRSLDIDPTTTMFTEAAEPPVILTVAGADGGRRTDLEAVADVVEVGEGSVQILRAIDALAERGARVILTEGGPTLLGQIIADGLLDEVDLTLAPTLVAGASKRVALSPSDTVRAMSLAHLWESDGVLLTRYVRV